MQQDKHAPDPAAQPWHKARLHRLQHQAAKLLLGIVGLYLLLYAIIALILQSHVNHLVAQQLGIPRAFALGVNAWPPGLALKGEKLAYASPLGEQGGAEAAQVTVPLFMPWIAETRLTRFTYANSYVRVALDEATSRTPLYARRLAQYQTKVYGVSVWPATGEAGAAVLEPHQALRVGKIVFDYQRRIGPHDAANPEEESTVTLAPVILPSGAATAEPLTLDQLSLRTTAEPAIPRDLRDSVAVAAWQAQGGQLGIAPLALDALGTNTTLAGTVTLDESLVPTGKLTLTFTGLDRAYTALKTANLVPPAQYAMLGNFLQLMPEKGAAPFTFPVTVHDHAVFFMDGPLFELNRLPWEQPTTATLPTDDSSNSAAPPTDNPTASPTDNPTASPTDNSTASPTDNSTASPTASPTLPLTPADPALPVTPGLSTASPTGITASPTNGADGKL